MFEEMKRVYQAIGPNVECITQHNYSGNITILGWTTYPLYLSMEYCVAIWRVKAKNDRV